VSDEKLWDESPASRCLLSAQSRWFLSFAGNMSSTTLLPTKDLRPYDQKRSCWIYSSGFSADEETLASRDVCYVSFVTCRKWSGMLGIGVCAPIALACCWLINGFVSAGNGGDDCDRISTTLLCFTKCLKSFGCGILIHFLVAMQL